MQIPGWREYSKHRAAFEALYINLWCFICHRCFANLEWSLVNRISLSLPTFGGFGRVLGSTGRGGIEVQSSQRRAAKIMTVLNGEEEPPTVKLTLVVTLEELGVLSSDLLIFGCFIVLWGFPPSTFSFWFLGGDRVLWGEMSSEIAAVWGFRGVRSESWQLSRSCDG